VTAAPVSAAGPEDPIVTVEVRSDGVAVIALDDRRETHNTITPALGAQLARAIDRVD
jgi:enoyl-CoA hydratase/carnithine racemase